MNTGYCLTSCDVGNILGKVCVPGFLCVWGMARSGGREIVGFPICKIASRPDPRPRTCLPNLNS